MPNGRPLSARGQQIKAELEGKRTNSTVTFDLQPDEVESFSRFTQRCRTVAKGLGMKVGIRSDRDDRTKAIVTVKETGLDPKAKPAKTGRRGRPKKEEAPKEEAPKADIEAPEEDAPAGEEPVEEAPEAEAPKPKRARRAKKADAALDEAPEVAAVVEEVVVEVAPDASAEPAPEEAAVPEEKPEEDVRTVAVCVSGSIAAYKACEVVRGLQRGGCDVAVAMTPAAERFVGPATFAALTDLPVAADLFDWPVSMLPHIDLAEWADLIVVAPASADCIAKLAHGLADDCVCATVLAATSPVIVCPSMNVHMWQNPATQANVATLRERGVRVLAPAEGYLVCGDWGEGKLAPVDAIVGACLEEVAKAPAHEHHHH